MAISGQFIEAFQRLAIDPQYVVNPETIQKANDTIIVRRALAYEIHDDTSLKELEALKTDVQKVAYVHHVTTIHQSVKKLEVSIVGAPREITHRFLEELQMCTLEKRITLLQMICDVGYLDIEASDVNLFVQILAETVGAVADNALFLDAATKTFALIRQFQAGLPSEAFEGYKDICLAISDTESIALPHSVVRAQANYFATRAFTEMTKDKSIQQAATRPLAVSRIVFDDLHIETLRCYERYVYTAKLDDHLDLATLKEVLQLADYLEDIPLSEKTYKRIIQMLGAPEHEDKISEEEILFLEDNDADNEFIENYLKRHEIAYRMSQFGDLTVAPDFLLFLSKHSEIAKFIGKRVKGVLLRSLQEAFDLIGIASDLPSDIRDKVQDLKIIIAEVLPSDVMRAIFHHYPCAHIWLDKKKLWKKAPPDEYVLLVLGMNTRDDTLAKQQFLEVLKLNPQNWRALSQLGMYYYMENKFKEAEEACLQALEQYPKDWRSLRFLGSLYEGQNRVVAEREALLLKVLALLPRDWLSLNLLGVLHLQQQKFEEAEKFLSLADKINPAHAEILFCLGIAYLRQGKYPLASAKLDEAHRLLPNEASIAGMLGEALCLQKKFAEAKSLLQSVQKQDPIEESFILALLEKVCTEQGRYDEADEFFRELKQNLHTCSQERLDHLRQFYKKNAVRLAELEEAIKALHLES